MLLVDFAHMDVLPEIGQAFMAHSTWLFQRDFHSSHRLWSVRSTIR